MVEKISARVFCPREVDNGKGGNPVTVFTLCGGDTSSHPEDPNPDNDEGGTSFWSARTRQRLAQSCPGPSVMVYPSHNSSTSNNNTDSDNHDMLLSFHLPNGDETKLSAHAAMAGAIRAVNETEQKTLLRYTIPPLPSPTSTTTTTTTSTINPEVGVVKDVDEARVDDLEEATTTPTQVSAVVHDDDIVSLHIENALFTQERVPYEQQGALYRLLRSCCGLQPTDLPQQQQAQEQHASPDIAGVADLNKGSGGLPTMMRVALRFFGDEGVGESSQQHPPLQEEYSKLLVYVKDVPTLLEVCRAPSLERHRDWSIFHRSCQNFNATGLLLYTSHPEQDGTWLCRHFPQPPPPPSESSQGTTTTTPVPPPPNEDAASGLALATLATAIQLGHNTEIDLPFYRFQQGQSMGRPSWIMIEDVKVVQDLLQAQIEAAHKAKDDAMKELEPVKGEAMSATATNKKKLEDPVYAAWKKKDGIHTVPGHENSSNSDDSDDSIYEPNPLEDDISMYDIKAQIHFTIVGKIEIDETLEMEMSAPDDDNDDDNEDDETYN